MEKVLKGMKIHCLYNNLIPIAELRPHPKNRNTHPEDQIRRLADILEYQGWRYPVKVSRLSGFVTSGHGRIEAAKLNGWTQVPVNYQEYESDAQEYADVVADNSIASWAELDLSGINTDIVDLGPDLNIDLLGIKDFVLEPFDKYESPHSVSTSTDNNINQEVVETVNKGDENAEWVGMPEFETGGKYINLTFQFKTELERELYCQTNDIRIDKKMAGQWIVYK